jgi:DhnA family fructose-bisphosphate aldolase class Ia
MTTSINARLNRLLAADGKCLDVALDHGFFNEPKFLQGIEDIGKAVCTICDAGPDAIQLTLGQARHLQSIAGKSKPSLVLRTDLANVYGESLPRTLFSHLVDDSVEQALRLDAACVVVNLFQIPNEPEVHHQCVTNISRLKNSCDRFGMPLMVEPLVMQANSQAGGYMVDGDVRKIVSLVRQAVELGADIIKADPCDNVEDYHLVVQAGAHCPVMPRGGGRVGAVEVLQRTKALMDQGAAGIVYGRNIIQFSDPRAMTRALMAVVHANASVESANVLLSEKSGSQKTVN